MELGTSVGPSTDRVDEIGDPFEFVELSIGEAEARPRDVDREDLRRTLERRDLDLAVHLPFRQPLVTAVERFNRAQREYLDGLLGWCADLGVETAVVHADARDPRRGRVSDDLKRRQIRLVSRLGEDHGVEVCFENVGNVGGLPLSDLGPFLSEVDAAACFDVGHAFMEGGQDAIERFLDAYGDLVSHLHVHDARARGDTHIPVGSGDVDWAAVGTALDGYDGTATVEVFTGDLDYLELSAEKFVALS